MHQIQKFIDAYYIGVLGASYILTTGWGLNGNIMVALIYMA